MTVQIQSQVNFHGAVRDYWQGSLPGTAGLQKYLPFDHIYNIYKYLQSKHLKGRLGPPVSDVTFFGSNGGPLGPPRE